MEGGGCRSENVLTHQHAHSIGDCRMVNGNRFLPSPPRPPPRPLEAEGAFPRVQGRERGRRLRYEASRLAAKRHPRFRPFTRRALRLCRGVAGWPLSTSKVKNFVLAIQGRVCDISRDWQPMSVCPVLKDQKERERRQVCNRDFCVNAQIVSIENREFSTCEARRAETRPDHGRGSLSCVSQVGLRGPSMEA
jgi:hypothetical protein